MHYKELEMQDEAPIIENFYDAPKAFEIINEAINDYKKDILPNLK
jgi:inorganic pyrophosphatase